MMQMTKEINIYFTPCSLCTTSPTLLSSSPVICFAKKILFRFSYLFIQRKKNNKCFYALIHTVRDGDNNDDHDLKYMKNLVPVFLIVHTTEEK